MVENNSAQSENVDVFSQYAQIHGESMRFDKLKEGDNLVDLADVTKISETPSIPGPRRQTPKLRTNQNRPNTRSTPNIRWKKRKNIHIKAIKTPRRKKNT